MRIKHTLATDLTTMDATPTTATTFALPDGRAVAVTTQVVAYDGSGNSAVWQLAQPVKRFSGTAGTLGSLVSLLTNKDIAATTWAATLSISGTSVIVQVTGAAATTISWVVWTEYLYLG